MKVSAIITAAGLGKRMKSDRPKQFLEINSKPIIAITLEKFAKSKLVDNIVVVTSGDWIDRTSKLITSLNMEKKWLVVAGGKERQDSVYNGIKALPEDTDIVAIHDGVRPFIDPKTIDEAIELAGDTGAVIVAVPVKDTIKSGGPLIDKTIDRSNLWAAQTPQVFKYKDLLTVFENAMRDNFYGTDEAMLFEREKRAVTLLKGSYKNIKITTPEDIEIALAIEKRER